MPNPKQQQQFETWQVGESPEVVYSVAVVHELGVDAYEENEDTPGSEIGGILYGTIAGKQVRVTAARQIECGHSRGPDFLLSQEEQNTLAKDLADTSDRELEGLRPVGWYRSRTRGPIGLSEDDVALWNRFFEDPQQVVLVLRPREGQAVRASFFYRDRSGRVRAEAGERVFDATLLPQVGPLPLPGLVEGAALAADPPPELFAQGAETRRAPGAWWVFSLLMLVSLGAVGYFVWVSRTGAEALEIAFRLSERNGRLEATWDPASPVIRHARQASIEVTDGTEQTKVDLEPAVLRLGRWSISRSTQEVDARLSVESTYGMADGAPVVHAARFVARTDGALVRPGTDSDGLSAMQKDASGLQDELQKISLNNRRLEMQLEGMRKVLKERAAARSQPAPAAATVAAAPPPSPAAPPPQAAPEQAPLLSQINPEDRARPGPPQGFADRVARTPAVLPPAEEPTRRAPAYTGPTSGKLIWTGLLSAGATLSIDGRKPSSGALNGALPGVPVRVTVYPGELTSGGLSVFSGAQRHARGDVTEARSSRNGWLATRFVYDPTRAAEVVLSEAPVESSGHKRLQVRNGGRPVAVVVVEWEVAR